MNEPRVFGALIRKEREALERIVGSESVASALRTLPEEVREEYSTVRTLTRIRTQTVEAVYDAVANETGRDVMRLHRELVRVSMENALRGVWRSLLRFTSDEALVRRAPVVFSRGLSAGTLSARIIRPGSAEIRLTGWDGVSDMQINGIAAGAETVLTCAGRHNVRMASHRTLDGACWLATWHV
ncbi:MAG: DNA-binding transcriptional ArsR family regulator [Polyangiales bacterium]